VALDLKPAARAVRQLQLGTEFPNVEAMYRQRSLSRLLTKRLWSVALSYAGNDGSLQVRPAAGQVPACHHTTSARCLHASIPPCQLPACYSSTMPGVSGGKG
jgi:hypothetical protein